MESVILKIKVTTTNKEKGWFLHKTGRMRSLKDIAIDILSGQNPCCPPSWVLETFGIADAEKAAEFDTVVNGVA